MNQLPELIAVLLRPALMVAVAAIVYRGSKVIAPPHTAARIAFGATCALFALELASISIGALLGASAISALIGAIILGYIFKNRVAHG